MQSSVSVGTGESTETDRERDRARRSIEPIGRAGRRPRARPHGAGARQGGIGTRRLEPTIVSNRMSSPSAEPCARTNTPARKRATRLADAGRRIGDYVSGWNVPRVLDMHIRRRPDDACAREPTAKHSPQTHDTTSRHASGRYPTPVHACIYTHLTHANTPAASTERTPAGTGYCAFLGATAHFCAKVNAAQRVLQGNAAACRRPPRPLGAQ